MAPATKVVSARLLHGRAHATQREDHPPFGQPGGQAISHPIRTAKSTDRPTATEMVTDSKTLSSQPSRNEREPTVTT